MNTFQWQLHKGQHCEGATLECELEQLGGRTITGIGVDIISSKNC